MDRKALLATDAWRDWIVTEALTWLYTPYVHKAHVKGVGADCGTVIYHVYEPILGPFAPFPDDYPQDWALHRENEIYLDFLQPYVVQVPICPKAGIAVFKVGRNFSHGAIHDGRGRFVHAWGKSGEGAVRLSPLHFFKIGNGGQPREVKFFDVSPQWLLSQL